MCKVKKIDLNSSGVVHYTPIQNENCFEKCGKGRMFLQSVSTYQVIYGPHQYYV